MECTGFLERFSEFHDGEAADSVAFERHARKCARCRRYVDTVTRGLALLRAFPDIAVCEDFHPRLQHRIYNVREDLARRRRGASFTRVGVALAATILLALAIWGPELLRPTPEVALPPIVVSAPPSARAGRSGRHGAVSRHPPQGPRPDRRRPVGQGPVRILVPLPALRGHPGPGGR